MVNDDIRYIKQDKLADFREENKPTRCPILGHAPFTPVVDHDHKSGRIRGVVSSEGNALLGKIENFHRSRCVHGVYDLPTVLRALANYIEQDQGPYHPVGLRQVVKRFKKYDKVTQTELLLCVGAVREDIDKCKNSTERSKLYRKILAK